MDIKILATTISITKNGINIKKPIWNDVLSSLKANDGISVVIGISFAVTSPSYFESSIKRSKSSFFVCLNINSFKGTIAFAYASLEEISLLK